MEIQEAKGRINWIDDESVGYICECGEEQSVSIYSNPKIERWQYGKYKCPKCGRHLYLKQVNIIYEVVGGD